MNIIITSTISVLLVCGFVIAAPADVKSINCDDLEKVVEENGVIQGITTLNAKSTLASTPAEFEVSCKNGLDALKKLKIYNTKCNKALTQQVFKSVIDTRIALVEESCVPNSEKFNAVLESVKCIKTKAIEEVKVAEAKMILESQALLDLKNVDDKERVKRACCNVLDGKKRFMNAIKDKCNEHATQYSNYVDSYTSESLGLICPDAEKMEKDGECAKLTAINTDSITRKYDSFLSPMMKVIKTLDH